MMIDQFIFNIQYIYKHMIKILSNKIAKNKINEFL